MDYNAFFVAYYLAFFAQCRNHKLPVLEHLINTNNGSSTQTPQEGKNPVIELHGTAMLNGSQDGTKMAKRTWNDIAVSRSHESYMVALAMCVV
jgi:hypothetical protein